KGRGARARGGEPNRTPIGKSAHIGQTPRRPGGGASQEGGNGPPAREVGGARVQQK
ncbi:unnamed protein product, partial [Bubo scandiacus]